MKCLSGIKQIGISISMMSYGKREILMCADDYLSMCRLPHTVGNHYMCRSLSMISIAAVKKDWLTEG